MQNPPKSRRMILRPETFGALVYHFGNRKLSFLKHPDLLRVLENLDSEESVRGALEAAGDAVGAAIDGARVELVRAGLDEGDAS